ncbi:MAG: KDO2-lipid IV(A) lauroyltransferase, partial [Colwellia sp.]
MGRVLGRVIFKFASKRKHVALVNLRLCFPDKSEDEVQILLKKNFENTGIALFETGMGWWWPDWRVKRKVKI